MSSKSLFIIIIKILGLLFIQDIVLSFPQLFASFGYLVDSSSLGVGIFSLVFSLLFIGLYVAIGYFFIFRTDFVLGKLPLEKFLSDDDLSFKIHRSTILQFSVIIIGGIIVVNTLPQLLRQIYLYFEERSLTRGITNPDFTIILMYSIQLLIGCLLVYNSSTVVNFIELRRRKKSA